MKPAGADRVANSTRTWRVDRAVRPEGESRRPAKPAVLGEFFGRLAA
jgi:hypothetical protein